MRQAATRWPAAFASAGTGATRAAGPFHVDIFRAFASTGATRAAGPASRRRRRRRTPWPNGSASRFRHMVAGGAGPVDRPGRRRPGGEHRAGGARPPLPDPSRRPRPRAGPACPAYGGGQGGRRLAGPILRAAGRGLHPRRKGIQRARPAQRGPGPGGVHLREARRGRHGDGPGAGHGWREALHHMDRRPVGTPAGLHHGAGDMGRTGREYGRSGHTDGRVRRRIAGMGRA